MWTLIIGMIIVIVLMMTILLVLIGWISRQQNKMVDNSQISVSLIQDLARQQIEQQTKSYTESTQAITDMTTNLILGRVADKTTGQLIQKDTENRKDLLGVELTPADYLSNLPEEMRQAMLRDGLMNRTKNPLLRQSGDGVNNGEIPQQVSMTPVYEKRLMEEMSPFRRIPDE